MSAEEARDFQMQTKSFEMFRNFLFSRAIPLDFSIGLLTDEVSPNLRL